MGNAKVLFGGGEKTNSPLPLHVPLLRVVRHAYHVGFWAVVDAIEWWKVTAGSEGVCDQKPSYSTA